MFIPQKIYLFYEYSSEEGGQKLYSQQFLTICNGQWINLKLTSFDEIPSEYPILLKEVVDSIDIVEVSDPTPQNDVSDSLSPEMLGRLAGGLIVNIFFICLIIFGIWNKVLNWLKHKRGWAAELENSDTACQYEQQDCLRKANYEIKMYLIIGVLYFITVYFHILLCVMGQSAIPTLFVLLIYAFYSCIKNRKESLILIDRILADVCPERKKFYHIMLTLLMIFFIIIICWPLAVLIYMAGAFIYFVVL